MDKLTNNVQKLTNDIQTIKNDVNGLKNDTQSMKKAQEHIRRISAIVSCNLPQLYFNLLHTQLYNHSQGSGDDTPLEVVPFENGDDPTIPPVRCALFI